MKLMFTTIILTAVAVTSLAVSSSSAEKGAVNLVRPMVPTLAVEAVMDAEGKAACAEGQVIQKNGACCPKGTTNDNKWSSVCTPTGTIDSQIFNAQDITQYCPSADMFIVSDKNMDWTCADRDSTVLYPATGSEGGKFCRKHGYGHLIKIKPRGTVGCVKVGDSQGDGCIEAGTCSFAPGR